MIVEIIDGCAQVYLDEGGLIGQEKEEMWQVDFEVGGISELLSKINRLELDSLELHNDSQQSTLEKLLTKVFEFGREFDRGKK